MEFLKAQVRQLCTDYGKIHGFFWDINRTGIRDTSINEMIRILQPDAVINSRGFDAGDVLTTERQFDPFVNEVSEFEEFIEMTTSVGQQSWGYRKEEDYHTCGYLIRDMDKILAKGGNYVINVGPKPNGTFPKEAVDIIQQMGKWYNSVKESFDGTVSVSKLTDNTSLLLTRKKDNLYVHVNKQPESSGVLIDPIDILPAKAVLLNTGQQLWYRVDILPMLHAKKKEFLRVLDLPANEFSNSVMVIKLEFDQFPEKSI
jgi:alpha-L-fucosidase